MWLCLLIKHSYRKQAISIDQPTSIDEVEFCPELATWDGFIRMCWMLSEALLRTSNIDVVDCPVNIDRQHRPEWAGRSEVLAKMYRWMGFTTSKQYKLDKCAGWHSRFFNSKSNQGHGRFGRIYGPFSLSCLRETLLSSVLIKNKVFFFENQKFFEHFDNNPFLQHKCHFC